MRSYPSPTANQGVNSKLCNLSVERDLVVLFSLASMPIVVQTVEVFTPELAAGALDLGVVLVERHVQEFMTKGDNCASKRPRPE